MKIAVVTGQIPLFGNVYVQLYMYIMITRILEMKQIAKQFLTFFKINKLPTHDFDSDQFGKHIKTRKKSLWTGGPWTSGTSHRNGTGGAGDF